MTCVARRAARIAAAAGSRKKASESVTGAGGVRPGRAMRTARVLGAGLVGTGAELVTVEARFDRREKDRTEVVITGLPDPVIRESKGRLICALEAVGLHVPHGRLFLNLVPAARRKSGEILDLPLALGAGAAC